MHYFYSSKPIFCLRYENDDPIIRFTEVQLAEIRKFTLSKLIFANMDINSDTQRSAFYLPSDFL